MTKTNNYLDGDVKLTAALQELVCELYKAGDIFFSFSLRIRFTEPLLDLKKKDLPKHNAVNNLPAFLKQSEE